MKGTDYGFRVDASDFIAKMELFHARAKEAAAMAVFEEATDIMEKPNGARDQAPVDTSALRESGKVLEPVNREQRECDHRLRRLGHSLRAPAA
jgi:hypothetical protein